MKKTVCYVMSGAAHVPYLLVSIYKLRKYYDGPVSIYAWPDSEPVIREMLEADDAMDCVLGDTTVHLRQPEYRGKNAQFLDKIRVMQQVDADAAIYLDADTMPVGSIEPLFEAAMESTFVATRFNEWVTTGKVISKRISRLLGRDVPQDLVAACLQTALPSVNGGIFAAQPSSPTLALWEKWTSKVLNIFIADETVLHILVPRGLNIQVLGDRGEFNSSPLHSRIPEEDVRIWHFHGDCNVRRRDGDKLRSERGFKLWMPHFLECVRDNVADCQNWLMAVNNPHINAEMRKTHIFPKD